MFELPCGRRWLRGQQLMGCSYGIKPTEVRVFCIQNQLRSGARGGQSGFTLMGRMSYRIRKISEVLGLREALTDLEQHRPR